jgi:hypothetical protein
VTHKLDEGRERLRNLIAAVPPAGPRLPLVHSTDALAIGNMLSDGGKISPQSCPVFEPERLTYMFYGRAAYRPNLNEDPTDLQHYLPVCLIFRETASISIKRIYPFDSGAFQGDFYRSYLHRKMRLGDFLLEADEETPGRIVARFFSDNTNYIMGRQELSEPIDPGQFEAASYASLISSHGANALDSRSGGIEVQTDKEIDLAESVEAAILPSSLARSRVGQELRAAGIEIIPYPNLGRMRPNEYTGSIYEKCVAYLCRRELIDETRL